MPSLDYSNLPAYPIADLEPSADVADALVEQQRLALNTVLDALATGLVNSLISQRKELDRVIKPLKSAATRRLNSQSTQLGSVIYPMLMAGESAVTEQRVRLNLATPGLSLPPAPVQSVRPGPPAGLPLPPPGSPGLSPYFVWRHLLNTNPVTIIGYNRRPRDPGLGQVAAWSFAIFADAQAWIKQCGYSYIPIFEVDFLRMDIVQLTDLPCQPGYQPPPFPPGGQPVPPPAPVIPPPPGVIIPPLPPLPPVPFPLPKPPVGILPPPVIAPPPGVIPPPGSSPPSPGQPCPPPVIVVPPCPPPIIVLPPGQSPIPVPAPVPYPGPSPGLPSPTPVPPPVTITPIPGLPPPPPPGPAPEPCTLCGSSQLGVRLCNPDSVIAIVPWSTRSDGQASVVSECGLRQLAEAMVVIEPVSIILAALASANPVQAIDQIGLPPVWSGT